jgi:hypothetical protein
MLELLEAICREPRLMSGMRHRGQTYRSAPAVARLIGSP